MILTKKKDIQTVSRNILHSYSKKQINHFFTCLINCIQNNRELILKNNLKDIHLFQSKPQATPALLDRLTLSEERIDSIIDSIQEIIKLPCPLEKTIEQTTLKNGLILKKTSVPIGRIVVIYESRPNVTIDVAILCIKSRNSVVLKGGKESIHTNTIFFQMIQEALLQSHLPQAVCQLFIPETREELIEYIKDPHCIDLLVPRGGKRLQEFIFNNARVPILKHLEGICHIYLHEEALPQEAHPIVINSKCQRPGVCNAIETILIDKNYAHTRELIENLIHKKVEVRLCPQLFELYSDLKVKKASQDDWKTEYLDLIISIKQVDSVQEAIQHINQYGSGHSDSILTPNKQVAQQFLSLVDSVAVYHNTSTRFTDGYMMGKGAEIGISTDRLHARGPVGLEELMTYKYCIFGQGQIRE